MLRNKLIVTIIAVTIIFCLAQDTLACKRNFIPRGGLTIPSGEAADTWQTGYNLHLDIFKPVEKNFTWGARIGFNNWKPDAAGLLSVGGREMEIEKSKGWKTITELSAIVSYRAFYLPASLGSVWLDGGVGLYHLRWSKVEVLGNYTQGGAALNRTVTIPEGSEVVPGLSAGLSMVIIGRIEPMIRYQHIFSADKSTGILTVGIGLLAM